MNKKTFNNLKKYVKRNALKFVDCTKNASIEQIHKYKELKIGFGCGFGDCKLIYFIEICGKYIDDNIPQEFIKELYNIIANKKKKSEEYIQRQKFNAFIRKINRG